MEYGTTYHHGRIFSTTGWVCVHFGNWSKMGTDPLRVTPKKITLPIVHKSKLDLNES